VHVDDRQDRRQNVDDATITTEVKAKLAAEKVATLTKIDVRHRPWNRLPQRNGRHAGDAVTRRAGRSQREHVAGVVNNLTVKAQ
jgi:hypothetical protein